MYRYVLPILLLFAIPLLSYAQQDPAILCGQKTMTDQLLRDHPQLKQYQESTEQQLQEFNMAVRNGKVKNQRPTAVLTLPVVVHIIHNNGIENISDAQVLTGIQHLNEAFANTGYYDPSDGVNTQVQFCLAQRDPNGNATNGITRNVSPYTVMGGTDPYTDDLNVKDLNRWNPHCYINIWVVRSIPGSVAGYAYLPSVHGTNVDGIVMESIYFGSSPANSTVTIHEMGHYLGLYHTFEGACKNDDCTADGDRVCDTPPDQSTASANCATGMNSCSTDNGSGFTTDVNDLVEDYMDYGNMNCMKVFTQGQADRMTWHIQNVRSNLLSCKSCLSPCPAPITAGFTPSAASVIAGTPVNFTNSSSNAAGYEWYVNNVRQATTTQFTYTFNAAGTYTVKLRALSGNSLCNSEEKTVTITVSCPVNAAFTPSVTTAPPNTSITFSNGSSGATGYTWYINEVQQATTTDLTHTFVNGGFYKIKLVAVSGACRDSITQLIRIKDPCNEYAFRKSYGGVGIDMAQDVQPTADGGYILAGSTTSYAGGSSEAFLLKLDNQGNVTWINTYGGGGSDLFKKVILTSDGGYLAVGQTKSYGYFMGAVMVVKTDADGMEEWHQYYGENSTFGEMGNGVTATADGGYAIAGSQNLGGTSTNMLVFKIDATGGLQWSKVYGTANTDDATDIIEDNGALIVAGYTASGTAFQDGVLMKLDAAGTLQWTKMYDIGFQNSYMGTQIYRQDNHYLVTMPTFNDLTLTNGRRLYACKIDLQGNLQSVIVAGSGNTPTFSNEQAIPLPDGGLMTLQVSPGTVNSGLVFMKTDASGNFEWGKRHVDPALQETRALRQTADGGFISVGSRSVGGNTDIYVVKTDALANIPSCLVLPGASGNPLNYFSTTTLNWTTARNANFTLTPASLLLGQVTIAGNSICAYSTPCSVPDSCSQHSSFRKSYATAGREVAKDIAGLSDGNYIMAGEMTAPGRTDLDAVLVKINIYGDTLWTKRFGGPGDDAFLRVKRSSDGSIFAVGYTKSFGTPQSAVYVVKTDNNGNLLFYNTLGGNSANGEIANDMTEDRGGTLYITGAYNTGPASDMFVAELNVNGWGTYMYVFDNGGEEVGTGITAVNDSVMITGYMSAPYFNDAFLVKWNARNRSVVWSRKFDRQQGNDAFDRIYRTGAGFLVNNTYGTDLSNNGFKHGIVQMDIHGNIINAWMNTTTTMHNGPHSLTPAIDGGFAVVESANNANSDVYLYKFDANGNRQMGRQFTQPNGEQLYHVVQHDDGSYLLAGAASTDMFVIKTDVAGNTAGCTTDSSDAMLSSSPMTVQSFTWSSVANRGNFPNATTSAAQWTAPVATTALCNYAPCEVPDTCDIYPCDTVFITGTDTTCVLPGNTQVYTAHRNANCTAPITWTVDPAYADIVATTATTIELRFRKADSVMLYAEIVNDCRIIKDSLKIYLFASPTSIDLGPDRQLCQVSTSVLRAGPGFRSYRWQDGAADSTFTAYNTGTYHVEAYDYCGNVYKDTIVISQAPAVAFDLGPDRLICEKDTVTVTAPAGFTNYRWSADYKVNSAYGQTIRIYTDVDTLYSVTAEKAPGCIVTDTIRISLKKTPSIDLGKDTSFCRGGFVTLDAGAGFDSYSWNTQATTQQITVQAAGNYEIAALYANGCYARDTLVVDKVYDLPDILADATSFCDFSTATLTPLDADEFTDFRWSTHATTPVARIDGPGQYWVQVTDRNGCTGTDTILVSKRACGNKLYIPTAFTPNNDHRNDVFKPVVDGQLAHFRLAVFSRWGEKIFETTNAALGWPGDWKGKPLDTGSFVWVCTYQFAGNDQPVQTTRGLVTLVR